MSDEESEAEQNAWWMNGLPALYLSDDAVI